MSDLPTLLELKRAKLQSVRFPEGNDASYFQDFAAWCGLPSDRRFYIYATQQNGGLQDEPRYRLRADGYGTRENYGNGSISMEQRELARFGFMNAPDSKYLICKGHFKKTFDDLVRAGFDATDIVEAMDSVAAEKGEPKQVAQENQG